ncbi:YdeI/OmpD-associated family protein [Roseisolibacter sp. H3M3-2]|uniref:YdeI/OmpD-associated family protein n=1 Tax=Roseisolibacter sp. H3M3-2 TaxID=3031323 RepID=UPI0023DBAB23|nr:YdeI/OmpD-associated family protein [Roseisolibacter sp. H3M3-2]MDF1506100.1 YdeI/OmpD-associated family protein [Roseisolibacter sp. H3M3-2]
MTPRFFPDAAALRAWLAEHHASAAELLVGFRKAGAPGPRGLRYEEALDEALCVGWIDGVRRSLGAEAYSIRFTPRAPRSAWSAVNVARAEALAAAGRLTAAGRSAFDRRGDAPAAGYSYEHRPVALDPALEARFRADAAAWAFYERQPPSYRRTAAFYVMGAKRAETRERRLEVLRAASAAGRRITDLGGTGRAAGA